MKRAMHGVLLDPDISSYLGKAVEFEIQKPGTIRCTMLTVRPAKVIVSSDPNAAPVELAPTIIFEVDPDAPKEKRSFALVPAGKTIESTNQLEYRGHFLYPDGNIVFLFEEIDEPADFVDLAKRTFQGR